MEPLKLNLMERKEAVQIPDNPGFGHIFTDHVFEMDYSPEKGWHNAEIKPLQQFSLHPATMFFHYGQAVFEGLKAYLTAEDEVVLFRPREHFNRLNTSSKRVCIPEIDVDYALTALNELLRVEKDWIPKRRGEALYIRPFLFGNDPFLGVKPSSNYKFIILLSPVGAYYPEGFKPVKILVQEEYVRTVRKGLGECKIPANYAASLLAGEEARKKGFTQVLWLDGVEQKYIEEVGTMNIFIQFKNEVATPALTGGILPGVTRSSVIQILKDKGMNVTERLIPMEELVREYEKGNIVGVFGTGTAAVISSVGSITYNDHKMIFNNGEPSELAMELFEDITAMQYAVNDDRFGWLTYVTKKDIVVE